VSYRQDLEAAHRRIAALEAALSEKKTGGALSLEEEEAPRKRWSSKSEITAAAAAATPSIGSRIRSAWPLVLLVGLVFWFLDLTTITTNAAAKSSYVLFGILGALVLVARFILNIASSGKSSVGQRIMLIVAIPFLVPAAFVSLDNAGMGLGALAIFVAAMSGVSALVRWVRLG
jgi:hypothetical protein